MTILPFDVDGLGQSSFISDTERLVEAIISCLTLSCLLSLVIETSISELLLVPS